MVRQQSVENLEDLHEGEGELEAVAKALEV